MHKHIQKQLLPAQKVGEALDVEASMPNYYKQRKLSDDVSQRAGLLKYDDDAGLVRHNDPHAASEASSSSYLGPSSKAMASMNTAGTPMHTPPVKPLPEVPHPHGHQTDFRPRSGLPGSARKSRPNHAGMQQAWPHASDTEMMNHAQVPHTTEHAQVTFNPHVSYMRVSDESGTIHHEIAAENQDSAANHRNQDSAANHRNEARPFDSVRDRQEPSEPSVRHGEHASNTWPPLEPPRQLHDRFHSNSHTPQYSTLGHSMHNIAHVPQDVVSPHSSKPGGARRDHSMSMLREPEQNWTQQGKPYAKQDTTGILSLNQSGSTLVEWTPSPVVKLPGDSVSYANIPVTTASHAPRRSLPPIPHGDATPSKASKSNSAVPPNGNGWTPNQGARICSEVTVQRFDDVAPRDSLGSSVKYGSGKENKQANTGIAQGEEAETTHHVHRGEVLFSSSHEARPLHVSRYFTERGNGISHESSLRTEARSAGAIMTSTESSAPVRHNNITDTISDRSHVILSPPQRTQENSKAFLSRDNHEYASSKRSQVSAHDTKDVQELELHGVLQQREA
jgi:hypothetical protein